MSLYKRGKVWWIRFTAANGQRIHQSTETADRTAAQELHDTLKAQHWRKAKMGERPVYVWEQAVVQWCQETADKASHTEDLKILRWFDPHLRGGRLETITREKIRQMGDLKRLQSSPATANRHLALIRAILRRAAREWGWIDQAPPVRLVPRAHPTDSLAHPRAGRTTAGGTSDPSGGHGPLQFGNGLTTGERDRVAMGTGGFDASRGVDSSRPGQRQTGDSGAVERRGIGGGAGADRSTSRRGIHL